MLAVVLLAAIGIIIGGLFLFVCYLGYKHFRSPPEYPPLTEPVQQSTSTANARDNIEIMANPTDATMFRLLFNDLRRYLSRKKEAKQASVVDGKSSEAPGHIAVSIPATADATPKS
ncbi:hypothetical protein EC991_010308 [Linnemannia zychae]|nr:hypothetical protein EC991_010308 [Linnemannia zychae]